MARDQFSRCVLRGAVIALLTSALTVFAEKPLSVSKWDRAEIVLKSSVNYTNALQEAELRVLFVSPLGETNRVYGFWDGGKTWRVRFKPTFPGRWKYITMCSDTSNRGLNGRSGEFDCTATKGDSRFAKHGPIQIARSQQHIEHADRTSFLWLGDTAWDAGIRSSASDWKEYCDTRASQKFNVTTWRLLGDRSDAKTSLFTGSDRIKVNLETARELDAKVTTANRAGLLNAIAPLWEIGENTNAPLPEDQAILLMRYAVARWGADDVSWVVAFECDAGGTQATRWQRIGRAVFNPVSHAPVVLLPGESLWALDGFRQERWANIFGIQTKTVTDEASLAWLQNGPIASERSKLPSRPIITINPPAESAEPDSQARDVDSTLSRQLLWWTLLINTPAGVNYSAKEVSRWNARAGASVELQPWRQALTLPGAAAIAPAADFFAGKDFWRLESVAGVVSGQTGFESPSRYLTSARTETRDLSMIYSPQGGTLNIAPDSLPANARLSWLNPRTGESRAANSQSSGAGLRFETPSPEDWLLVARTIPAEKPGQLASRQKKSSSEIDKRK